MDTFLKSSHSLRMDFLAPNLTTMILETTNSHCFTYKTDELLIELLGGIRIDTLDRMRVTIKVTVINKKQAEYLNNPKLAGLSIRHNLDLYCKCPYITDSLKLERKA